ncbi:MAG: hypothetical protein U0990_11260 [Candidatus Nanopelagicales bacterium]|nr:hypothetical protein [Hyphomicrobiales bacterium]MDZ4250646.1 hypothetical protein [Candidatus Nanopelagicales bacterium]
MKPEPYEGHCAGARVRLEDTKYGVEIALDLMENGEPTAGTAVYLSQELVEGMANWLRERVPAK